MVAIDMLDEIQLFQLKGFYPRWFLGENAIQVYQQRVEIYVYLSIIFQLVCSVFIYN